MVRHRGLVKSQNFPRPKRAGREWLQEPGKSRGRGGSAAEAAANPMGSREGARRVNTLTSSSDPLVCRHPLLTVLKEKPPSSSKAWEGGKGGKWSMNTEGQIYLCEPVHVSILFRGWKKGVGGVDNWKVRKSISKRPHYDIRRPEAILSLWSSSFIEKKKFKIASL